MFIVYFSRQRFKKGVIAEFDVLKKSYKQDTIVIAVQPNVLSYLKFCLRPVILRPYTSPSPDSWYIICVVMLFYRRVQWYRLHTLIYLVIYERCF